MDHSYEEIRKAAIDILASREGYTRQPMQYEELKIWVTEVLTRREQKTDLSAPPLSRHDSDIFLEVFWDLFRQGIITLGVDDANRNFPFFRLSGLGNKIIESQDPYFFHDVSSYEKVIKENVSEIDSVTLIYLKEAMQTFLSGCLLSSSVMLGVSIEHSFYKLLEKIEQNRKYGFIFKNVFEQKTVLQKLNKFKNILDQHLNELSSGVKEDLDTNFLGIMAMLRNFRNESGHPSGKIISREQCFVNLNLFIPCCKKVYQLIDFF